MRKVFLLSMLFVLMLPNLLMAQLGNGQIQGVCLDPQGAIIPGTTITIRHTGTGTERTVTTDEVGRFVAPFMPVGPYDVRAELSGMAPATRTGLVLNVGATIDLVLTLAPAGVQQEVTVIGEAPLVESTKTDVSNTINATAIENLPINGRRWENFVLLTPGVTNDGTFGLVSFRGVAGVFNNTMVDGADNNQAFFSESKGRTRISYSISQESIREFQVNLSSFSAEFGRAAGGIVNAVTQSGTNEFHGSAFWYLRDKSFLALDPFAKAQGRAKPPERRHQFGASAGGPLVKDKAFFFGSYDQQYRNFPITVLPGGGDRFYTGSTAPAAATQAAVDFLRQQTGLFPRKGNQKLGFTKFDWQVNTTHRLTSSFNILRWNSPNGIQTGAVVAVPVSSNGTDGVHTESSITTLTSVISGRSVNELRFQYGRDLNFQTPNGRGPSVTISNSGGSLQYGMPNFLPRPAFPNEKRFEFIDNFSHVLKEHSLKFGVDINYVRDLFINLFQGGGVYSYSSLTNFALDFGRVDTGAATTQKHYTNFTQAFDTTSLDGRNSFRTTDYNFYFQDNWRVAPSLSMNLGVRYEYQKIPQPRVTNPALPQTARIHIDKNNWAPRFGLAWTPMNKTVFRLGYGAAYGRTQNSTISNFFVNNGVVQPVYALTPTAAGSPSFPNVLAAIPTGTGRVTINLASPDFVNPLMHQGNLELERELGGDFSVAVRYLVTRGTKLPTTRDANIAPSTTTRSYNVLNASGGVERSITLPFYTARLNPAFGQLLTYETVINSWYNAMVLQVNKRFSDGLQFMAYYTWSHSLDDGQGSYTFLPSSSAVLDPYNRRGDYGNSGFDQRQRFVFNGLWQPDFSVLGNGASAVLNGFKFSGVLTLSDGFPQTGFVQSINPAGGLGSGLNGALATNNRFPGVGRNSFVRPGLTNVDLRLAREFKFGDAQSFEFVWEAFNVANHVNYGSVNSQQYSVTGTNLAPNSLFLRPQSALSFPATGNPRQMQMALRYRF